jgi:hypothetical protein
VREQAEHHRAILLRKILDTSATSAGVKSAKASRRRAEAARFDQLLNLWADEVADHYGALCVRPV